MVFIWHVLRKPVFSVFSNFEKIRYCPHFVRLSVRAATTFQWVDRSFPFMAQSIAYDPTAWTKEGIFVGPTVAPTGGVRSPISIHFHIKIRFYWYLRRVMSLMLDRVRRGSKCPPTQKVPSDPKSAPRPKKCPSDPKSSLRPKKCPPTIKSRYNQWSVKIRLPLTQWRIPSFFFL
jgi:hypothetical protein